MKNVVALILLFLSIKAAAFDAHSFFRNRIQPNALETEKLKSVLGWDVETSKKKAEYKNLETLFVHTVNLFLTDEKFSCTQPAKFNFLKNLLNFSASAACEVNYKVKVNDHLVERFWDVEIKPERVYQIQFVLAQPGDDVFGSFGHAGLRIVLCDPNRAVVGEGCLEDVQYHLFFGFAADVQDGFLSLWRTVKEDYSVKPFFNTFESTRLSYQMTELRDVLTLPLRISESEKTNIINRMLEDYWSNNGTYAIFSRNCTTELLRVLQSSLYNTKLLGESTVRPIALYELLLKMKIIDKKNSEGFPSIKKFVEKNFSDIQNLTFKHGIYDHETGGIGSFDEYIRTSANFRLGLYQELKRRHSNIPELATAFGQLEGLIQRLWEMARVNAAGDLHRKEMAKRTDKAQLLSDLVKVNAATNYPVEDQDRQSVLASARRYGAFINEMKAKNPWLYRKNAAIERNVNLFFDESF
jgi:hypothetical protein